MSEIEERRQRAREAWHDEFEQPGTVVERHARAVETAIETATRAQITPELLAAAQGSWPQMTPDGWLSAALVRAFAAAGFEVEA